MSKNINAIVLGTTAKTLAYLRGKLIKTLSEKNLKMVIASAKPDSGDLDYFKNLKNIEFRSIHLKRTSLNFLNDIKTLLDISLLIRRFRPKFILAYGIKLVIWGGLLAQFSKIEFYALVTGTGYSFQGKSIKRKLLTRIVVFLYKSALRNSKAVIFHNNDNRNLFINKGIVFSSKTYVVNGSGVDIKKFNLSTIPSGDINFLCIARLLRAKGLKEYAAAAKIVKNKFPNVVFNLLGPEDRSPDGIPLDEIKNWSDYISYKGSAMDVRPYIKEAHIYVLPSYHEGMPNTALEAMSMGRPIITTDVSGCKETVKDSINGFIVPVGSTNELAEKMIWFIENKERIENMGIESRKIAEENFALDKVNARMLAIMGY